MIEAVTRDVTPEASGGWVRILTREDLGWLENAGDSAVYIWAGFQANFLDNPRTAPPPTAYGHKLKPGDSVLTDAMPGEIFAWSGNTPHPRRLVFTPFSVAPRS